MELPAGGKEMLDWRVLPGDLSSNFLEVW